MLALCVDDEPLLLSELVRETEKSPDITDTSGFTTFTEAVEWAGSNRPDIAFLDIKLRGHTGLELAEKLRSIYPDLPIIFCTGYREYALDAFAVHANGYLTKPVTAAAIQKEIDAVKQSRTIPSAGLSVQCFGNFEVMKDGKPLTFKRKRSKEVFAYLVDRRGASVSAKEISAALWEDGGDEDKNIMYLYKLIADLRQSLEAVGEGEAFVRDGYNYYVDTSKLDCDYYKYLDGDRTAEKSYCGEYMTQYSWAEATAATLGGGF